MSSFNYPHMCRDGHIQIGYSGGDSCPICFPTPTEEPAHTVERETRPCGCVVCICEDEDRCFGCGAKACENFPECAPTPSKED